MFRSFLAWLGYGGESGPGSLGDGHFSSHSHNDRGKKDHLHLHGVVDPGFTKSERGIWALKWSIWILGITATLEFSVFITAGSMALLADTIHNYMDAMTAIPLWVAFLFSKKKPSARFTYGYGRVEDFAGIVIVLVILANACIVGVESLERFLHPEPVRFLGWVALAGMIGFIGNEIVAVLRIRVGREIQSAALVSDGYHARTDGLTSLAVVVGALGVKLGFPFADPVIGLLIAIAILGIVWQSAKSILVRMLDGIEPGLAQEIREIVSDHEPRVGRECDVRARWIGHYLKAELDIKMPGNVTLLDAERFVLRLKDVLFHHLPSLSDVSIFVHPREVMDQNDGHGGTELPEKHFHIGHQ